MRSSEEIAQLRANVLFAFEEYSRLTYLGRRADESPRMRELGAGLSAEEKGAVFLIGMLNTFFSIAPEMNVYLVTLKATKAFVEQDSRMGGRAWGSVRERLLEIGNERGWSNAGRFYSEWVPDPPKPVVREGGVAPKKSGGCYVATAVYGSYDCPDVWVLRRFRDQSLSRTAGGRGFVRLYYALSPWAVRVGGSALSSLARRPLTVLVRTLRDRGVSDAPYADLGARSVTDWSDVTITARTQSLV